MALRIFKNKGESGAIPLSAENLNYNFQEVLNLICPVGKVEIFYDNDDHSNHLGFTWERTGIGKAIVGIDSNDTDFNTIGKTGGEKTHTLTVEELPEDFPKQKKGIIFDSGETTSGWYAGEIGSYDSGNYKIQTGRGTQIFEALGNGQSHNNLQPYEVFAIWKRTA